MPLHSSERTAQALITKLAGRVSLTNEDCQVLLNIPLHVREYRSGEDIVHDGETPNQCCLVLDGWLFRYKLIDEGKRQILSLHVPGEIPDLQSFHLRVMDHTLAALSTATVAMIAHTDVRRITTKYPHLAGCLWRETLIDAAIFREWMTGLGRRNAYVRAAHLVCEMYVRLEAVGLVENHTFRFPLTQESLADALGLTSVHVNRTVRALKSDGLLTWKNRELTIIDWHKLVTVAQFDPTYLHLMKMG